MLRDRRSCMQLMYTSQQASNYQLRMRHIIADSLLQQLQMSCTTALDRPHFQLDCVASLLWPTDHVISGHYVCAARRLFPQLGGSRSLSEYCHNVFMKTLEWRGYQTV